MNHLPVEHILLIASIILFFSLFWERITRRFEVPVLLFFLILGVIASNEHIGGLEIKNLDNSRLLGSMALSIILFSGGLEAKFREVKSVLVPSSLLATLGVIFTTLFVGLFIYFISSTFFPNIGFSLLESFLLASIVASTDFALVFAIFHSKGMQLKNNLRPLLEFESGSNDVMAYLLLLTFLQFVQMQNSSVGLIVGDFFYKLIVGALCGFLLGKLAVRIINRVKMTNDALYPVLLLAISFIIFIATDIIGGSNFLAVYIGGLTVGNSRFLHKRSSKNFFDGFAWLAQILMFFTFGMLINPAELLPVATIGILIGVFIIFAGRPLAVWSSIGFCKNISAKAKFFISWVGLRGAVPLIFATYILSMNIEQGKTMFNIVFFVMLVSLLVQGTSVSFVARLLKLSDKPAADKNTAEKEDIKSAVTEFTVTKEHLQHGNRLMEMQIPENTIVALIRRGKQYLIPQGSTHIHEGDVLLMISDDEEAMRETYQKLGINYRQFKKKKLSDM